MNDKEKILAGELLKEAAEKFSTHGCCKLDFELIKDWSEEELEELNREMHVWNGSPAEDFEAILFDYDWMLMRFFAEKLGAKSE